MQASENKLEYRAKMGDLTHLAGIMRQRNNNTLNTLYTQVEAIMGESKQAEAFKNLIKWEIWKLTDDNQESMYRLFRGEFDTTQPLVPLEEQTN